MFTVSVAYFLVADAYEWPCGKIQEVGRDQHQTRTRKPGPHYPETVARLKHRINLNTQYYRAVGGEQDFCRIVLNFILSDSLSNNAWKPLPYLSGCKIGHGWFSLEMRMAGQHLFIWTVMCIVLERKISGAVEQEQHEDLQQVSVGECALLPCLLPLPPPSLGDIRVYWQTDKTYQVVHVFNKGQEEFTHQSPSYHNRTRLFTNQLQFGNFSLELRNVSEYDNLTTFQCLAFYHGSMRPTYQNTTLLVLREDECSLQLRW
ncbi:uncharacterized protein LOC121691027 isoform X2 [Alosa sapidissima]|uniref:uncharacterized protein LOC121691027 isoform X2 n=1 Tax=Alosa sapidissima TaxID=34773 RepID=UPI001C087374|nr:uncharacterized protein LOC121691027 isoform X2 [Alosa sapidissima]